MLLVLSGESIKGSSPRERGKRYDIVNGLADTGLIPA